MRCPGLCCQPQQWPSQAQCYHCRQVSMTYYLSLLRASLHSDIYNRLTFWGVSREADKHKVYHPVDIK